MKKLLGLLLLLASSYSLLPAQNFNFQFRSKLSYPGQTLANICGYWQDGREYALIGGSKGLIIADITNPDQPVDIVQIPGPDNLWKEIKTYRNFAYITSEGGGGLQIVDLSNLPDPNPNYTNYTGDGAISGTLNTIHALHIDTTRGFAYLYGSNLVSGGAVVLNLEPDPFNPTYAGQYSANGYIHDGFADNDTMYSCHIYAGTMNIVDMTNKSNPKLLGTVSTPAQFTHNSWLLDDHKTILTTDERVPSFLAAYDISDPTDIRELDRFSTNDGFNSIGHNTHVLNDFAVTSWYTDGVTIVDASRPQNLVMTGWYDTWNGTGPGFDGCWGAYPFFPSGTVIASNISPAELFILTPTYQRACYLEGAITNGCSGTPLKDAVIDVNSTDGYIDTKTNANGLFKTGQAESGTFQVSVSYPGFITQTLDVVLTPGEVTQLNITLEPQSAFNITGTVIDSETQAPISNAPVQLAGLLNDQTVSLQTNGSGQFTLSCLQGGEYELLTGSWGYLPSETFVIDEDGQLTIPLKRGFYDDFALDYGWQSTATASSGNWERGAPQGTTLSGEISNPGQDSDLDRNDLCYVTGNGGGSAGTDDVDNGTVTLTSPVMDLSEYDDAVLTFWYWFFNAGGNGGAPDDNLEVTVSNGIEEATLFDQNVSDSKWRFSGEIKLSEQIALTDNMRVKFVTGDQIGSGHIVEAGLDIFSVVPTTSVGTSDSPGNTTWKIYPNPTQTGFFLQYDLPQANDIRLEVHNALGQIVLNRNLAPGNNGQYLGAAWPPGAYSVRLFVDGKPASVRKLIKG